MLAILVAVQPIHIDFYKTPKPLEDFDSAPTAKPLPHLHALSE